MSLNSRLKKLKMDLLLKQDMFTAKPDFDNMSDAEVNEYHNKLVVKIKDKFGLVDDLEVQKYFEAINKWYDIYEANKEEEGAKFIAAYESELMIKKWERETGLKYEVNNDKP